MFVIIGSLIVVGCVLGGFVMEGGKVLALWHPSEIVVIVGAAVGAFVTSNPMKVIKGAVAGALSLVKGPRYKRADYVDLLNLLYDILVKIRKSGMLAIEADIETPDKSALFTQYPRILADHHMMEFITDCLRLIVGGNLDPHELESLLEYELETHHKEESEPGHAVQAVADSLPGFGIVAAVLGIVNTMSALDGADTATIGEKVGAALVGTFLGILVAYGFAGPMASAMAHRAHEGGKAFEVVKMALVASVRGYAPPVAVEFARKLLFSDLRPSFADLENHLKNKKKEGAAA
ncbi:MAG TPA: flagellar motor stator protein MotA [Steroidobacteraceae bacterium]|nr:flagellar motor stator protein MotA [Steroidobacteraceae bacterium]